MLKGVLQNRLEIIAIQDRQDELKQAPSKNPTTYRVPESKEDVCAIIDKESLLDIDFNEKEIHLNAYSTSDLR